MHDGDKDLRPINCLPVLEAGNDVILLYEV